MQTLCDIHERNAAYYPNAEAMVCGERRVTHAEFLRRARQLSSALYRAGLRRQDRAAILSMNCLEYYEVYAAGEVSRFIITAINFRLAPPEVAYILSDSAPKVFFFEAQYAELVDGLRPKFPDIGVYVCIGGAAPAWAVDFETFIASGDEAGAPMRPTPDDYSCTMYTSGTTGRPKGVVQTHRAHLEWIRIAALDTEFSASTCVLQTSPAFHVGGTVYIRAAQMVSGKSVIHRVFEPVKVLETIQRERTTFTFMVATMIRAVVDVPDLESYDLSSMQTIITAAAPIPVPLLKRAIEVLGPVFQIQYGGTEFGIAYSMPRKLVRAEGSPEMVKRLGSVGHPTVGTQSRVVNDDGADCKVGEIGEVWIRNGALLDAYWNNSAATRDALEDGWYKTGDMGVLDDEQYLYLVDRKKDMIISGGENIYSREVEEALHLHPAVFESAVIGVPDSKYDEAVKAIVELKPGQDVSQEELIAFSQKQIARYKCPKTVDFLPELPRLPSGKVNKVELRKRFST